MKDLQKRVIAELSVLGLHSNSIHVTPQVLMKAITPLDTSGLFVTYINPVHPEAIQRKAG